MPTGFDVFLPAFRTGADMMQVVLQNRLATQRHQDEVGFQLAQMAQQRQYQAAQIAHLNQIMQMKEKEDLEDAHDSEILKQKVGTALAGASIGFPGGIPDEVKSKIVDDATIEAFRGMSPRRAIPFFASRAANDQKNEMALGLAEIRARVAEADRDATRDRFMAGLQSKEKMFDKAEEGRNTRAQAALEERAREFDNRVRQEKDNPEIRFLLAGYNSEMRRLSATSMDPEAYDQAVLMLKNKYHNALARLKPSTAVKPVAPSEPPQSTPALKRFKFDPSQMKIGE